MKFVELLYRANLKPEYKKGLFNVDDISSILPYGNGVDGIYTEITMKSGQVFKIAGTYESTVFEIVGAGVQVHKNEFINDISKGISIDTEAYYPGVSKC